MIISEEDKKKLKEYVKWLEIQEDRKNGGMIGNKIHLNKKKYNRKNKHKELWLSQD
tara:strand:+ start:458 stop:625 length:168 start_codon:yes stop_codon:yes gene_type:complete